MYPVQQCDSLMCFEHWSFVSQRKNMSQALKHTQYFYKTYQHSQETALLKYTECGENRLQTKTCSSVCVDV